MEKEKKFKDKEVAALVSSVVVLGSLIVYWFGQYGATTELLEMAYGTVKLFNNPLVF